MSNELFSVLTVATAAFFQGRLSALVLLCPVCRNLKTYTGKAINYKDFLSMRKILDTSKISRVPSVYYKGVKSITENTLLEAFLRSK